MRLFHPVALWRPPGGPLQCFLLLYYVLKLWLGGLCGDWVCALIVLLCSLVVLLGCGAFPLHVCVCVCVCVYWLHRLGCTCKSTCDTISANRHQQQHRTTHSSTQLGPSRHCKTEAESAAQSMRLHNKQEQELGNNNKLANTQPDAPLAPHTAVCGSNAPPVVPQRASCINNHRCHSRHRQYQNTPSLTVKRS